MPDKKVIMVVVMQSFLKKYPSLGKQKTKKA